MAKDYTVNDEKLTEEIEFKTNMLKVKSAYVKADLTEDYTLAKINDIDKDFISENYENAKFVKNVISSYKRSVIPKFDFDKFEWVKNEDGTIKYFPLKDDDTKKIDNSANEVFSFLMVKPDVMAILTRNKEGNFLPKLLMKDDPEQEQVAYNADDRSILKKLADKITGNDPVEDTD